MFQVERRAMMSGAFSFFRGYQLITSQLTDLHQPRQASAQCFLQMTMQALSELQMPPAIEGVAASPRLLVRLVVPDETSLSSLLQTGTPLAPVASCKDWTRLTLCSILC